MTDRELYKAVFSRLRTSERSLTEVIKMSKQGNTIKMKKRFSLVLITVVVAIMLTGTAFAVAYHTDISEWFNSLSVLIYGRELDNDAEEVLGDMAENIGESVQSNGTTVTAEAIIGDEYNVMLMLRVKVPDDVILDGKQYDFAETDVSIKGKQFESSWQCSSVRVKDNECLLILSYSAIPDDGSSINNSGYTLNVVLEDFSEFVNETGDVTKVSGNWSFDIPLKYELAKGKQLLAEDFSFYARNVIDGESECKELTIKSFEISSLGYKMTFDKYTKGVLTLVSLIMKDGTEVKCSASSSYHSPSGDISIESGTWTIPVKLSDAAYIKFGNGKTVPITELTVN